MAAINLSSPPLRSPPPIRCYHLSKTATTISLYSHPKPSFLFPKISLRPKNTTKPRYRSTVVSALSKLSDADLVDVPSEPDELSGTFPSSSGVYAVYDKRGGLQFIGMSRNIASSILTHQKSMPELCCSVKVGLVDLPVRTAMAEVWKSWMEEYITATGKVPPGNEPGNTTWFRQPSPPRKTKSDLRLTPGRNTQLTVPLEQLINRLVKENTVVAFIKGSRNAPLCGFSQKVVGILNTEGVEYESVDVLDEEHNPGLRETLKKYSNWPTFPQVFVNGELVGGCDILSSMHEKGELSELIWK